MASLTKKLTVRLAETGVRFTVGVFEGVEPAALVHAVAGRAALPADGHFFFTLVAAGGANEGVVVPLSASLPDGVELMLHRTVAAPTLGELPQSHLPTPALPREALQHRSPPQARQVSFDEEEEEAAELSPGASSQPSDPLLMHSTSRSPKAIGAATFPRKQASSSPAVLQENSSFESATRNRRNSFVTFWTDRGKSTKNDEGDTTSEVVAMVDAVERLGRLTTDLANERTLLAWIRTCFAAIRTTFTYINLNIGHTGAFYSATVLLSEFAITSLVVALAFTGAKRYESIKAVLSQKVPPASFGRISVRYTNRLVVALAALTVITAYVQHFR